MVNKYVVHKVVCFFCYFTDPIFATWFKKECV